MPRTIASYMIYLKEDLQVARTCQTAKERLLRSITDETSFSPTFISYFKREDPNQPFKISNTDPKQVALLKKILNSLAECEGVLSSIENIDITASTPKLLVSLTYAGYRAINKFYTIIHLINDSHADLQSIIGPPLKAFMPTISLATTILQEIKLEGAEQKIGDFLAHTINILPEAQMSDKEHVEGVSQLLFNIPTYFAELHTIIGTVGKAQNTSLTPSSDKNKTERKAEKASKYLSNLLKSKGKISSNLECFKILKALASTTTDLVNTAAPLTKDAYLNATMLLEKIKHEYLPLLVAELEAMEERIGLKPGVLTDSALQQMNTYYTQLATNVQQLAEAAQVIDSSAEKLKTTEGKMVLTLVGDNGRITTGEEILLNPLLQQMEDEVFVQKRREYQQQRLSEARLASTDDSARLAAILFFQTIATNENDRSTLAELPDDTKRRLIKQYQLFQPHVAGLDPKLDRLIVDGLTKPVETGWVAYLTNAAKLLWSTDHFSQIGFCYKDVLASIEQSKAQAQFTTHLITQTIKHAEQNAPSSKPTPFELLPHTITQRQPVEHYMQQAAAVERQLAYLENAQQGMEQFFETLKKIAPHSCLHELDEAQKTTLLQAYHQFQSVFMALEHDDYNNQQIIQSLTSNRPSKHPPDVSRVLMFEGAIKERLERYLVNSKEAQKGYLEQAQKAKQKLPLLALDPTGEKKTLFGLLQQMKLSESIATFFEGPFEQYLKEHVSPTIWAQLSQYGHLDRTKIPYQYNSFYQDSPELLVYKQLINAIYYLKKGLADLETLHSEGDPNDVVREGLFLKKVFDGLIKNLNNSKWYLTEAAKNPGLTAIIQEGLALLKPIENWPLIGDYLTASPAPSNSEDSQPKDAVTLWQEQQAIVQRASTQTSTPQPEPALHKEASQSSPTTEPKQDAPSYMQQVAKALYTIPLFLQELPPSAQTQQDIADFIADFSGLAKSAKSAQKIIRGITKLQKQLNIIGNLGREAIFKNLKEIRSEFGFIFIAIADEIELQLGLKSGTYSAVVSERFDRFYQSFISNLHLESEQTGLEAMVDVTHTQKRLQKAKDRLVAAERGSTAPTMAHLLGDDFALLQQIYTTHKQLKLLLKELEEHDPDTYKERVKVLCQTIPGIDLSLIKGNTWSELEANTQIILDILASKYQPSSAFTQIQKLALTSDFSKVADQHDFLHYYQAIQPNLHRIDYRYDLIYFLRELQTPADFIAAAAKISDEHPKLQTLVTSLEQSKALKIHLAQEQVTYFNALLAEQKQQTTPKMIEAFKTRLLSRLLAEHLESLMYPSPFIEYLLPILATQEKTAILGDISLDDDMEEKIADNIREKITPMLIDNEKLRFKEHLFKTYLDSVLIPQLDKELGVYSTNFFDLIIPSYQEKKTSTLANLEIQDEIVESLNRMMGAITIDILTTHRELKETFASLNLLAQNLHHQILMEMSNAQNPCRIEKITKLRELQQSLTPEQLPPDINSIRSREQQVKEQLERISDYDTLLTVYESLDTLIVTRLRQKNSDAQKLVDIQAILFQTNQSIDQRIDQVIARIEELDLGDNILTDEALKSRVFNKYLISLQEQLSTELGPYAEDFLNVIKPDLIAQKEIIINTTSLNQFLPTLKSYLPNLLAKYQETKDIYKLLKQTIEMVNHAHQEIENEGSLDHPCRAEKMTHLMQIIKLIDSELPLQTKKERINAAIKINSSYDEMIEVYDLLATMKNHVEKSKEVKKDFNQEKIKQLKAMQDLLADQSISLNERLQKVASEGLKTTCQDTLTRQADNFFMNCWRKFKLWCTKTVDTSLEQFKTRLLQLKNQNSPPLEEQPAPRV